MDKYQLRAVLAGILFGLYPLLLNRSNLPGNITGMMFSFLVAIFILPFGVSEVPKLAHANWVMLISAGMLSAIAMMCMTNFLTNNSKEKIGLLIILMIVTQASVTAIFQMMMDRGVSITRLFGFIFAVLAVYLLNKR